MKKLTIVMWQIIFFAGITLLSKAPMALAQTDITGGIVSGLWVKANSPYLVNGEITVPDGETLTIEPGVDVVFTGHYKFIVQGRLLAIGTKQDSITFTAQNPDSGWHGLRLKKGSVSNDSTILEYCVFQYGKANSGTGMENRAGGAINSNIKKLRISHCLFSNNLSYHANVHLTAGGAIALAGGAPIIEYCEFKANTSPFATAMVIYYAPTALIRNNYFHDNNIGHGVINIGQASVPIFINNLIENNISTEHGIIHFAQGSGGAVLINNTIVNNTCTGGAIWTSDPSEPLFINNIIYGNKPAQVFLENRSGLDFIHCLIEGGQDGIVGKRYFTGTYQNCLESDPLFVSSTDFHLQDSSPCIGAGLSSYSEYIAPGIDLDGNPRPNPQGSSPDIGAFESELNSPFTGINNEMNGLLDGFQLFQNFPNPFNPSTLIGYSIPTTGHVKLTVYDINGREVAVLVDETKTAGSHEVQFNASHLPSGIYVYQLETAEHMESKKLMLLK